MTQRSECYAKTLLVWTDQGLGDTLMMIRYLPMLKERGFEKVIVCCEETLVRVVQRVPGVDEVVSRSQSTPVGGSDCHCPITSLPFMFKTRVESIPNKIPYLHVPDELRRKWAEKLAGLATPRVGLAWAGRKDHPKDALRSTGGKWQSRLLADFDEQSQIAMAQIRFQRTWTVGAVRLDAKVLLTFSDG